MAEKLCELRKKGGGSAQYTETSLWTNPSPSVDFAAQTITLSDSLSNYKYIAIRYNFNKNNTDTINKVIYLMDDFRRATQSSGTNHTVGGLSVQGSDNRLYTRNIFYVSDTSVSVSLSQLENGSGTYAAGAIPIEILGLNELAQGTRESSLGTLTYQTSSNFKVTLGYKPKALQVILRGNDTNTITLQYDESISTTKYIRNYTGSTPQSGWQTIGNTSQRRLYTIDDDGFTLTPNTDTSTTTIYYCAVGDV